MQFSLLAIIALAGATATQASVLPRQEPENWCRESKASPAIKRFQFRQRGMDTDNICRNRDLSQELFSCLNKYGCGPPAPGDIGSNCGQDEKGFIHGGFTASLTCGGDDVNSCLYEITGKAGACA